MKNFIISIVLSLSIIPTSLLSRTTTQTAPIDLTLASQYFQEAHALCSRDNDKLWGVSLCAPMLFVDRKTRSVVANQVDKEGSLTKNGNVYVGQLPAKVNVANTATAWAGVKWTMIIFPLPEDGNRRASLMAHEMWHRIQDDIGFPASDGGNNHLDSRDGRIWLQLEWRALATALNNRGTQRRQAITDALLFRAHRRTIFPNAGAEERAMEMNEGLAEYTGVKLSGNPNLNQYVADTNLREGATKQSFVRSFAYASSPVYGILLDDTKVKWRKNLKREDDLGNLLQKKLSIKLPQNIKQAAELRAKSYDGDRLQAVETERENNQQKLLAEYRARLVDGAVLEIPLQKMNMQFNLNNLMPLGALGTVYPDIRVVDVWGILTVSKGGALMNSTYSKIYISTPINLNKSPIKGDDWTLELNAGWTIANGGRKGDYIVKKLE